MTVTGPARVTSLKRLEPTLARACRPVPSVFMGDDPSRAVVADDDHLRARRTDDHGREDKRHRCDGIQHEPTATRFVGSKLRTIRVIDPSSARCRRARSQTITVLDQWSERPSLLIRTAGHFTEE